MECTKIVLYRWKLLAWQLRCTVPPKCPGAAYATCSTFGFASFAAFMEDLMWRAGLRALKDGPIYIALRDGSLHDDAPPTFLLSLD